MCTSTTIAAREPVRRFSGGMSFSYSGVPNSNMVPVPHRRTMRAAPSNAQNMIVTRLFSFTCEIVSTPVGGDQTSRVRCCLGVRQEDTRSS